MSLRLDILAERQPCTAGGNSSTQGRLGAPESTCAAHEIAITPEDKERQEEAEDKEEGGRRKEGDEKEGGKSWVGEEGKGPGGRLPTRRSPCPAELQLFAEGRAARLFPERGQRQAEWANGLDPTRQGTAPIKRSGRQPERFAPTVLQHAGASLADG